MSDAYTTLLERLRDIGKLNTLDALLEWDQDTQMPPKGVTAHAEILVQDVENKLAIPVQAIYAKGGQRYVFRQKGDRAEPVVVQMGAIGSEWAEVASGIDIGDRVLLAFGDEYRRMIPDTARDEVPGAPPAMRRPGGPRGQRGGGSARQSSASPAATPVPSLDSKGAEEKTSESQAGEKTAEQPASLPTDTSSATPGGAVAKPLQTAPAKGYSVGKAP